MTDNNINLVMGFTKIQIIKCLFFEIPDDIIKNWNINYLKYYVIPTLSYDIENEIFNVILELNYKYLDNIEETENSTPQELQFVNLIVLNQFKIKDLKNYLEIVGESTGKLPENLLLHLISLSYSSLRGVFASITRGSFINQFVVPLVDPKTILNNINNKKQNEKT